MNIKKLALITILSTGAQAQGLDFFLYSSRVYAETLAGGFTGYTYTGPFTNQTHLIASAARISAALEDLAGFDINNWATTNTVITNLPNLVVNSITYTNTYWDDSQVPAMGFRVGTTAPTFDQFTDAAIYVYRLTHPKMIMFTDQFSSPIVTKPAPISKRTFTTRR